MSAKLCWEACQFMTKGKIYTQTSTLISFDINIGLAVLFVIQSLSFEMFWCCGVSEKK